MEQQNQTIDFANLCKKIREHYGLSVKEMAEKLGASIRGYNHWELGDRKPSADVAYQLARIEFVLELEEKVRSQLKLG